MKDKLPLNPNVEIFRWGPAQMRFYYNSDFEGILTRFSLVFPGEHWPHGLFIGKGPNMVWVNGYPELREGAVSVFVKYMLNIEARQVVWNRWLKDLDELNKWQRNIDGRNLSSISDKEFLSLWMEMREILLNFWTNVLVPEYGNYGADGLLETELKKQIKDESELGGVMETLTAPEKPSFFQKEELDLLKTKNVVTHAKQYFWLMNSYNGTEVLPASFFEERKSKLNPDLEKEFSARQVEVKKRKADVKEKYHLPKKVMDIGAAFVKGVEWQDERKAVIWHYLYYKDLMIAEAAERLGFAKNDLLNFGTSEILEMLEGEIPDKKMITDRYIAFSALMKPLEKPIMISSEESLKYWDLYAEDKAKGDEREIKGTVVSRGDKPVTGIVRLLFNPKDSRFFNQGEILVAPMTTPEYVFVMKKASAVITNVGGLMSHAAIVSRELKIPCIVGTKIATKVLKDGDLVEVNTGTGSVKIIERHG